MNLEGYYFSQYRTVKSTEGLMMINQVAVIRSSHSENYLYIFDDRKIFLKFLNYLDSFPFKNPLCNNEYTSLRPNSGLESGYSS